jgi:dipeptidyl aminopeptidase/acylaminoacyl peptidase
VFTRGAVVRPLLAVVGAVVGIGVAAAAWMIPARSDAPPGAGPAPAVVGAADDTTTPFNLVDVPALLTHRYDGHGLGLVGVVHREAAFTRWAIVYEGDGLRLTGTLTLPNRRTAAPVVVVAHGWSHPGGYRRGGGLDREEDALGRAGFAVLHPDYRNYGGSAVTSGRAVAEPDGYPVDIVNAVLALRTGGVTGLDLGRVGLLGRSMGGGAALQAAVARPDLFRAVELYSPVSSLAADDLDRWAPAGSALRARVERAYGTPATQPVFWHDASVRYYLDRLTMPVQVVHGTADPVCPFAWSVATARAMRAAGVQVDLQPFPGEGHRFDRLWPRYRAMMLDFWEHNLG